MYVFIYERDVSAQLKPLEEGPPKSSPWRTAAFSKLIEMCVYPRIYK